MQKNTMRSLKQQLSYSKRERNRLAPVEHKKGVKKDDLQSGTVIKVTLDEPVTNISATKVSLTPNFIVSDLDVFKNLKTTLDLSFFLNLMETPIKITVVPR